jgi:hypothetical protein
MIARSCNTNTFDAVDVGSCIGFLVLFHKGPQFPMFEVNEDSTFGECIFFVGTQPDVHVVSVASESPAMPRLKHIQRMPDSARMVSVLNTMKVEWPPCVVSV